MTELEEARRKFLDECDAVVRSPGVIYTKGNDSTCFANIMSLPLYIFLGIRRGCRTKNIEMMIFDESEDFINKYPNCMIRFKPGDLFGIKLFEMLQRDFLYMQFYKDSQIIEKELSPRINWTELVFLDELSRICQAQGEYELKIWSELPFFKLEWISAVYLAFCTLMFYVGNNLTLSEFNMLKKNYKQNIVNTGYEYLTLNHINDKLQTGEKSAHIINKIFAAAIGMRQWVSPVSCFTSLFGNFMSEKDGVKHCHSLSYKIEKIYDSNAIDDLSVVRMCLDILYKNKLHISLSQPIGHFKQEFLILKIGDEDRLLFGSLLGPLFAAAMPFKFDILWTTEKGFSNNTESPKGISYDGTDLLALWGPENIINKVKYEFKKNRFDSKIIYDSSNMGWDYEGTKVLDPDEFKLTKKQKIKKIRMPPEIPETQIKNFELGFDKKKGNSYLTINSLHRIIDEKHFTILTLVAASTKRGILCKRSDLYIGTEDRYTIDDIRDELDKFGLNYGSYLVAKKKTLSLNIPLDFIHVDESICNFKSIHWDKLNEKLRRFYDLRKELKSSKNEITEARESELKTILINVDDKPRQSLLLAIKHTLRVQKACQIMGWNLKDNEWERTIKKMRSEIEEILRSYGLKKLEYYL